MNFLFSSFGCVLKDKCYNSVSSCKMVVDSVRVCTGFMVAFCLHSEYKVIMELKV